MITVELDQVEVDYCTSCHGIWLDKGELEILFQGLDQAGAFLDSFEIAKDSKERKRKCPICSKKMLKVFCGEKEKVLADECPKKDGLWCDAGELQQMIRAADFQPDGKVFQLLKNMFQHPVP